MKHNTKGTRSSDVLRSTAEGRRLLAIRRQQVETRETILLNLQGPQSQMMFLLGLGDVLLFLELEVMCSNLSDPKEAGNWNNFHYGMSSI